MATQIIMPQMGESIAEGTITKWYKKQGDQVERDEPLFEISTDKVDTEIPSPAAGVLTEIKVGEGETVPINTVVGVIGGEAGGETPAGPAEPSLATTQPTVEVPKAVTEEPKLPEEAPAKPRSLNERVLSLRQTVQNMLVGISTWSTNCMQRKTTTGTQLSQPR